MKRAEFLQAKFHCGSCGSDHTGDQLIAADYDPHRGGAPKTLNQFPNVADIDLDCMRCPCGSRFGGGARVA